MKIKFDKYTFWTIASLIGQCYGYPMDDVKEKSGYSEEEFEALDKKVFEDPEGHIINFKDDPNITIEGSKQAVKELTENLREFNKEMSIDISDFPIIIAGSKLAIKEMTEGFPDDGGDLLTIVDITKEQGLKLISLLESIQEKAKNSNQIQKSEITVEDW